MINNVTLMGRITAPMELKQTQSGVYVTAFCIAVDRRYSSNGERTTDFINCVAWRSTAEFIHKYFGKGDLIALTGEIQTRKYEDKNGNNRVAVEVVVNNVSFCGGKSENKSSNNGADNGADDYNEFGFRDYGDGEDDLPF